MIAIRKGNETHQIVSYNTTFNKATEQWELWVTRSNGRSMKMCTEDSQENIDLVKEALDYAIENKHPMFTF